MISGMAAAIILPIMVFLFVSIASPWGIELGWPLWVRVVFGTMTVINIAYCALALYADHLNLQEPKRSRSARLG